MSSEENVEDPRMTLGQHLEELRWRLLKAIGWIMLAAIGCLSVQQKLMNWATYPHRKVTNTLRDEVRFGKAPDEARDVLAELTEADEALAAELEEARRAELRLTEDFASAVPQLQELQRQQAEIMAKVRSLNRRLGEVDSPSPEALAPLRAERERLLGEAAELHLRYEREAKPYVDLRSRAPDMRLMDIKYQGPFLSYLKLALVCAIFVASPLVARELWGFVAVGLYPHEKRYVNLLAPISLGLFVCGGIFGYFVLIPVGLYFLATYAPPEMMAGSFALSDYLSLFMTLTVVVGLVFELPLVMSFFTLIGVFDAETYRNYRQYFLLAAPIIGAVFTPPDPFTQVLLALPMILLYEIGILSSVVIGSRRSAEDEDEEGSPPPASAGDPRRVEPLVDAEEPRIVSEAAPPRTADSSPGSDEPEVDPYDEDPDYDPYAAQVAAQAAQRGDPDDPYAGLIEEPEGGDAAEPEAASEPSEASEAEGEGEAEAEPGAEVDPYDEDPDYDPYAPVLRAPEGAIVPRGGVAEAAEDSGEPGAEQESGPEQEPGAKLEPGSEPEPEPKPGPEAVRAREEEPAAEAGDATSSPGAPADEGEAPSEGQPREP